MRAGDVLVADMTDPDWEPVMKRAAAIVTNRGGRTCHAAIIARELGIPAVVGCVTATSVIRENQAVTVSCAEGDTGHVYDGMLEYDQRNIELDSLPRDPRQDHDEHRQSRPGIRFRRHTEQGRRSGAARIHHQSHDRRASARSAGIRQARARSSRRRSLSRLPAIRTRSAFMSTSWPKASRRSPPRSRPSRSSCVFRISNRTSMRT